MITAVPIIAASPAAGHLDHVGQGKAKATHPLVLHLHVRRRLLADGTTLLGRRGDNQVLLRIINHQSSTTEGAIPP